MKRAKRPGRVSVPLSESDWEALVALRDLYGERSLANTARRAIVRERARCEREEADRLAAAQSRRELQAQLGRATP